MWSEGGGEEELCGVSEEASIIGCLIGHGLDLMVVVITCYQKNN